MTDATTRPPQGSQTDAGESHGEADADKKTEARVITRRAVDDRHAEAERRAQEYADRASRYRKRAERMSALGRKDKARDARRTVARAEKLRDRWTAEAFKLKPHADRLAAARRVAEGISLVQQARLARAAASLPRTEKEERVAAKRERLEAQQDRAKASSMRLAGVPHDARTAAGRRDFKVESLGGTKRARSQPYRAMLGPKATPEREAACERFDMLWHASQEGLLPGPKFEPGVDSGKGGAGIPKSSGALDDLAALTAAIGEDRTALLRARIVDGLDFRAMERAGEGDARALGVLFVAAVDAAVRAWS